MTVPCKNLKEIFGVDDKNEGEESSSGDNVEEESRDAEEGLNYNYLFSMHLLSLTNKREGRITEERK